MEKPESLTGPLTNQADHRKEHAPTLPSGTVTFLFTDIEGSNASGNAGLGSAAPYHSAPGD